MAMQNACECLGKLAKSCPMEMAGLFADFAKPYMMCMGSIEYGPDKVHSAEGFTKILEVGGEHWC